MTDIYRNEMTAPCGCLVEAMAACECYEPAGPPLSVAEALTYAATLRPGELTEGSESEVVATLAAEVERLRAIEARAQAASVAGVDAIVRDAALHILNYGA